MQEFSALITKNDYLMPEFHSQLCSTNWFKLNWNVFFNQQGDYNSSYNTIYWSFQSIRTHLLPFCGPTYDRPQHFSVTVVFGQSQRLVDSVARNGCIWVRPLHRTVGQAPVLIAVVSSRRTSAEKNKRRSKLNLTDASLRTLYSSPVLLL